MNFEALSDNIKGLLTATRAYRIPRFQRDFSWDQTNYNEFLNDMLSQIQFEAVNNKFHISQYFLGNMLFLGKKEGDLVDVIDGQQRITSITILLAAIRNALFLVHDSSFYSENDKKLAYDYADTIQKEYLIKKIDGEPQRKVQTSSSFPYFTQSIQDYETGNPEIEPTTEEEELLQKTFRFFSKELEEGVFIENISDKYGYKFNSSHYVDALKALRDQVLNSQIIEVFVAEKEQAHRIFENINSKGKPLSQVDLIKNAIFSKIEPTNGGVDEISSTWSGFNKKIMDLDTSFDEFFLHYWKAVYPYDSPAGTNLYKKFLKRFGKKPQNELQELVKSLGFALENYSNIINPNLNDYKRKETKAEYEYLVSINRFKGVQVRPALLAFYFAVRKLDLKNIKVSRKLRNKFLRTLSTFHFAAFGTDLKIRSNKVTAPYNDFSKSMSKVNSVQDLSDAIGVLQSKLFEMISEEPFVNAFQKLEFSKKNVAGNKFDSYPASYAITQISNYYEDREYNDDEYSIEHIIDESITGVNNIGNLTVLEERLNQKVNIFKQKNGNMITFDEKKLIYSESNYKMVELLCENHSTSFKTKEIKERSIELARLFWNAYFKKE